MSERSILFNGPMVQAILDGRKTQTRRVIRKPERLDGLMNVGEAAEWCPYGQPGDLLWVRETWGVPIGPAIPIYKADYDGRRAPLADGEKWRPSIHMPKQCARIWLRITNVRVERIQEVNEEDADAEGMEWLLEKHEAPLCNFQQPLYTSDGVCKVPGRCDCADFSVVENFAAVWDSINQARGYSWDSNPWVWVIEFEWVKP